MSKGDFDAIAVSIRDAIAETPKKSKRVYLKTLLSQYGYKTRQKHIVEAMHASLIGVGIVVSPSFLEAKREDWVILSVIDPNIPVADFAAQLIGQEELQATSATSGDPWLASIAGRTFHSEKEVEIRLVIPLLDRLGFDEEDRADGFPVEQTIGVRKVKTEADFVVFDGPNRSKDNALLVIEAKNVGKRLTDHVSQAKSYAMFLGTPYFLVTNGDEIRVFLYRSPIESDVEVFCSTRQELPASFSNLYNLISRPAIVDYKRRKSTS